MTTVLDKSIIHLLRRASQRAAEIFATQLRGHGVTARQYAVLAAVASKEGSGQVDLVRLTGIDRSTLSDVIQRMTKRGWLERRIAAGDGRKDAIYLMESGQKLFEAMKPDARRAEKLILDRIGGDTKLVLRTLTEFVAGPDQEV